MTKYDPRNAALLVSNTLYIVGKLTRALQYLERINTELEPMGKAEKIHELHTIGNAIESVSSAQISFPFLYEHIGRTKLDKHGRKQFMRANEALTVALLNLTHLHNHTLRATVTREDTEEQLRIRNGEVNTAERYIKMAQYELHTMIQPVQLKLVDILIREYEKDTD